MNDDQFRRPTNWESHDPDNPSAGHAPDEEPYETSSSRDDHTLKSSPVPEVPRYAADETDDRAQRRADDFNQADDRNGSHSALTWQNLSPVELYEYPVDSLKVQQPAYFPRSTADRTPPPPPPLLRESAVRSRARRRSRKRSSGGEWAWVIVSGAILGIVVLVGIAAVLVLQSTASEPKFTPTATLDIAMLPPAVDMRDRNPVAAGDAGTGDIILLSDGTPVELKPWDGDSRFTILAMGMDRRPGETGLAHLTDTMILISIDPRTRAVGLLSIPRDMYVQVPGYSALQRINTAMVLGEVRQPGSGPQLAMQTVQYNLGIRVHEYLVVDFKAVIDLIDAIGGIQVTTDYTIDDPAYPDMFYGYDPFYLPAGTHDLNGETALKFARTRHGDNDIERAHRQQQVIFAVRDRVLSFDMLPGLITQAPMLLASLNDNVQTGLTLQEMIELAWFIKDIDPANIAPNVIDFQYLRPYTTERGEQVLIPNRDRLGSLMVETFGANYSE
ncbi:MAG: LCP family protein [Chloroflexota bacterium]